MTDLFNVFKMEDYESRLATFKNWVYNDSKVCNARAMAHAGFYHCPNDASPDATRCFFCLKELDGWEETDDPYLEHLSHSKDCMFLKILKDDSKVTVEHVIRAELARCKLLCTMAMQAEVDHFQYSADMVKNEIDNAINKIES